VKSRIGNRAGGEPIDFRYRIFRTRPLGSGAGVTSSPSLISSVQELRTFLSGAHISWQWADQSVSELVDAYDEHYFEDHVLVAGVVSAGSGSTRVNITGVSRTEEFLTVIFQLDRPAIGTADMMSWHYFVEIGSSDAGDLPLNINLPITRGNQNRGGRGWTVADR